jgi:hypothetical protein
MAKALAEFRFRRLGKYFMAASDYDEIPLCKIHPSNGAAAQIVPWPSLLRFRNNNVLRCEVVSLTTNPR